MAPKRQRSAGSSSFDSDRFVSREAQARYVDSVSKKGFIQERGFELDPNLVHDAERIELVADRQWEVFVESPELAVISIVREFYSNFPERHNGKVFVRGKWVAISRISINRFYQTPDITTAECQYQQLKSSPTFNLETITEELCNRPVQWKITKGKHISFKMKELEWDAKHWAYFICARLLPTSHVSDVTRERAILLYCILTRRPVDVGRIIFEMMLQAAEPSNHTLYFPSLITEICRQAGVIWDPQEEVLGIRQPVNSLTTNRPMRHPVNPPAPAPAQFRASSSSAPPEINLASISQQLEQISQFQQTQAQRMETRLNHHDNCLEVLNFNFRQFVAYTEGNMSPQPYRDLPPPPTFDEEE